MSRPSRRLLHVAAPVVLAAGALVAVSACGSAVPAQSVEHSVIDGVNAQVGSILIRDATIQVGTDGRSGSLFVALYNQGSAPDQLTAVTSPGATVTLPSAESLTSSPAPATGSPYAARSGVTALPTAPSASPSPQSVDLAAQAAVLLDQPPSAITITDLPQPLRIGGALRVTMTFAAAGTVTLDVPVSDSVIPSSGGLETATPAPDQAGAEEGTDSPNTAPSSLTPFAPSTSQQPTSAEPSSASPTAASS